MVILSLVLDVLLFLLLAPLLMIQFGLVAVKALLNIFSTLPCQSEAGMVHILFDCKLFLGGFLASFFQFHGGVPMSVVLASAGVGPLNIHGFNDFISVCDYLSWVDTDSLSVYMNSSVKNLGTIGCRAGAVVFFENINLGLSCVFAAHSVHLFLDSQAALDACRSESDLVYSDFHNQCWVKHWHIRNVIRRNNYADSLADTVFLSGWYLSLCVDKHFLLADGGVVSGNSRHFEVGSGSKFLDGDLCSDVNWLCSSRIWHPDLHMATAVWKHIYNKCYPSVLCLYCGKVEVSNHVFFCVVDDSAHHQVLESCMSSWRALFGLFLPSLDVLQLLSTCALNFLVSSALYKSFVFNDWLWEAISIFHDPKVAGIRISDFHHAFMEKNGLIFVDGSIPILIFGLVLEFLAGVIKLLSIAEAFGIRFGFRKSCSFFSGIGDLVSVNISV
ncbi:hypothetical protein G9A89_022736 [Geosiphon pyriformis]|nr:hypothetical protein G9A89_022736 [Geosiphon pyriformis]